MATTLQVAQHHDTTKVTDVQRVCSRVGSEIGRHHVGVDWEIPFLQWYYSFLCSLAVQQQP